MNNPLIVSNISISQVDGLYRLNDLHKAAGGENRHQPGKWLELDQTKSYISHLIKKQGIVNPVSKQNQVFIVVKNGGKVKQGTYVCKKLVYKYAIWISHEFEDAVIDAYDSLVQSESQYKIQLIEWKKVHVLEKPTEWSKLYTEEFYKPVMRLFGWQFITNAGGLPWVISTITRQWIYNAVVPTEILKEIDENRDNEKIHSWFTCGGREKLMQQINSVALLARTSRDYEDFKRKANVVFNNAPLQLEMFR